MRDLVRAGIVIVVLSLGLPASATAAPLEDKTAAYLSGDILPGDRIGPVRLRGSIDELKRLFGPGTTAVEGGLQKPQLFSTQNWSDIGLLAQFDSTTGNMVWVSVEIGHANAWAQYATPDEIRLGTHREDVVSRMGSPERTFTAGGYTSLYYDRRGIRLTVVDAGPLKGKVGSIRVVWPAVPRGDSLIIPGQSISGVRVGAPTDSVLAFLEGGYSKGESAPGRYVYYWPHLGLALVEVRPHIRGLAD